MVRNLPVLFVLTSAALVCAQAPRKVVTTETDLPRFSYQVPGDVQHLLNMPVKEFSEFAVPIRSDIDKTLSDYEIQDHAAHRKLLHARLDLELLSGDNAAALRTILQIRALEDKPVFKLTSALNEEAIARARMTSVDPSASGCPAGYQPAYQKSVQALPGTSPVTS